MIFLRLPNVGKSSCMRVNTVSWRVVLARCPRRRDVRAAPLLAGRRQNRTLPRSSWLASPASDPGAGAPTATGRLRRCLPARVIVYARDDSHNLAPSIVKCRLVCHRGTATSPAGTRVDERDIFRLLPSPLSLYSTLIYARLAFIPATFILVRRASPPRGSPPESTINGHVRRTFDPTLRSFSIPSKTFPATSDSCRVIRDLF